MKYKIKKGDTLIGLAKKHNLDLGEVMRANPGLDARSLQIGQEVELPGVFVPQEKKEEKVKVDNRPIEPVTFEKFVEILSSTEEEFGLPAGTLAALSFTESSGNPFAASDKSAKGLFQFTPIFIKEDEDKGPGDTGSFERAPRAVAAFLVHARNRMLRPERSGEGAPVRPNIDNYIGAGWDKAWELAFISYTAGLTAALRWLNAGAPPEGLGNLRTNSISFPIKISKLIMQHGASSHKLLEPGWRRAFKPRK